MRRKCLKKLTTGHRFLTISELGDYFLFSISLRRAVCGSGLTESLLPTHPSTVRNARRSSVGIVSDDLARKMINSIDAYVTVDKGITLWSLGRVNYRCAGWSLQMKGHLIHRLNESFFRPESGRSARLEIYTVCQIVPVYDVSPSLCHTMCEVTRRLGDRRKRLLRTPSPSVST